METAIITGASSGIGTAITKELLLLGYKVFGFGRDFSTLLADLKEDKTYAPLLPNLTPITLDLTKTGTLAEKIREMRKNSEISLLVNNAGVGYFGLHEVPMLLCQLLLRDLKKTGGHIIQISSVTAKKSSPHGCAYGATKAGLSAFTQSLFDEARKYGVRITCIHPDMTRSNFYRDADFGAEIDEDCSLSPEDIAACVHTVLTARSGMVFPDITLTPQKHRISRNVKNSQ